MKNKKLNEGIRIAKEGIDECWDDMDTMNQTTQSGEPMTVTLSMPGKNISVTTDSADEIANVLRLAGIEVGNATSVPGDVDGDGDHDIHDHEAEVAYVGVGSESEPSVPEQAEEEQTEEAVQTPATWTDKQGNTHPATRVQGDRYGNQEEKEKDKEVDEGNEFSGARAEAIRNGKDTFTVDGKTYDVIEENETEEDNEDYYSLPMPNGDREDKEVKESAMTEDDHPAVGAITNRIIRQHPDLLAKFGPVKVMAAIDSLASHLDELDEIGTSDVSIWVKRVIEELEAGDFDHVDEATQTNKPWTDMSGKQQPGTAVKGKSYGNQEEEKDNKDKEMDESARIIALSGVNEWANSPEGKAKDKGTVSNSLPSAKGTGKGSPDFGANRANGQGENPMGDGSHTVSVEEQFESAMGEYRKFVAENIARKK
jgi:hypothetical protein